MLTSHTTGASASTTSRRGLGGWGLSALYAACAAVLLTNAGIYLPPAGHRFVDILRPGAADLIPSFNAAHALLRGENPYHADKLLVPDPYAYSRGEFEGVTYLYPPSHALLYVPLALIVRGNYAAAIQVQFVISLVCVALLAFGALQLLRALVILDTGQALTLLPSLLLVLALNAGNMLGIERGQSDVITALLAWYAVLAFARRRPAAAAFLVVAASLLKGYGVVLALGLLPLGVLQDWRRSLLGAGAAVALLLLPVARYLPDAFQTYQLRSAMFWSGWTNQGFSNLAFSLGIEPDVGRLLLSGFALLTAALSWFALWRARAQGEDSRVFWVTAFATAALSCVVGYSRNSIAYDVIIVMPGALVLALGQEQLFAGASDRTRTLLGATLALALGSLFMFDLADALGLRVARLHIPLAAAGQVLLLVLIARRGALALRQPALAAAA